jgi:adenylate cyclase
MTVSKTLRNFPSLIPALVFAAFLYVFFAHNSAFDEIHLKVFDLYQKASPRRYEPVPVKIIDIDDESLARLGQWPWPRTRMAELVRRLADLGAASISLDIIFAEPDRTSPENALSYWPDLPEVRALKANPGALPRHDRIFAETIARAGNVVTAFALTGESAGKARPAVKAAFAHAGENPAAFLPSYGSAVPNLQDIENAGAGNGNVTMVAETDGIIRRLPLVFRLGDRLYPSLAAEAVRVSRRLSTYQIKSAGGSGETSFGRYSGISRFKIGDSIVPTDGGGRIWLYDTGPVAERYLPACRIFEGKVPREALEGQVVFVGTSATGLKDLRASPLYAAMPGVELHAQVAEQILLNRYLTRPDWAAGAEAAYLLVMGLTLVLLLPRLGALWCAAIGFAGIVGAFGFSWYSFLKYRALWDPVSPSLASLMVYLAASLVRYLRIESEKKEIRLAFGRYLSPAVVERISEHPEILRLGGERKNMSVLFADIRGFTTLAEKMDPEALTRFMNRFLSPMTEEVLKNGGTVDKYMGDCLMAFWNAPMDEPLHAKKACLTALRMREDLVDLNRGGETPPVRVGTGINTGDCCVGNMGSAQRFDYSVIGDEVNLAARLQGLSAVYEADIVIGEHTYEKATDLAAVELDLIQVKGKTRPTRIFALLGGEDLAGDGNFRELARRHSALLSAYRSRQWKEAGDCIRRCLEIPLAQERLRPLYALYEDRVRIFTRQPPAPDWNGVFIALSK